MNAEAMNAALSTEGKIIGIEAKGNVTGASDNADEKEEMASNEAVSEFWPVTGRAKDLTLKGSAKVHTTNKKTGEVRDIQSDAVHVNFAGATMQEKARVLSAETLTPGTLEWTNGAEKLTGAGERAKLQAGPVHLGFAGTGKGKLLQATGNV